MKEDQKKQHTPLPWKCRQKDIPNYEMETTIYHNGVEIAVLLNNENETENADFIVLACNNHYVFLGLLRKIKEVLDEKPMSSREYESIYTELEEVLSKHS